VGSGAQGACSLGQAIGCNCQSGDGTLLPEFFPFIEKAAQQAGIVAHLAPIENVDQIVNTIEQLAKQTQGLVFLPAALFTTNKELIVRTIAGLGIPAMYSYTFWRRRSSQAGCQATSR
jgi:hypothetical protein